MKTAEEILKGHLIKKHYLFAPSIPIEQINSFREDILKAMEEYRNQSHPTSLPSDWTKQCSCNPDDKTGETWCCNTCGKPTPRLSTELPTIASARIAEVEREKPSLADRLFTLANDFALANQGDIAVKLHSIRNSILTTP